MSPPLTPKVKSDAVSDLGPPTSAADSAQNGPRALTTVHSAVPLRTAQSRRWAPAARLFHELPSTLFGKDGCFNGCLDNDGPSNNARSTTVGGLCPGIPWCPKSPQHSPLYSLLTLQSADNARSQKEGPGGADPAPLSPAAGLWRSRPATDVCALWE